MAVESDLYDNFTRCPTSSPAMNDPEADVAICMSALVRGGLLKVGNFQAPITSPAHIQMGLVSKEGSPFVPEGMSLEASPFVIPNPFYTPPATAPPAAAPPPQAPAKKRKKKAVKKKKAAKKAGKKKGKKAQKKHQRKTKKKRKKKPVVAPPPAVVAPVPPAVEADPFIRITMEPVGDFGGLNLGAVLSGEGPLFELSTRLHLQGAGLGPSCYIGSAAEPITIEPAVSQEPTSVNLAHDPNGLPVEVLELDGMSLEDEEFTVPGAKGCGIVDPATQTGSLDQTINATIGLPAVSGGSKVVFTDALFELAGTLIDGTPPDGGAQLQEAFDAAR
ncbi:MAG TPA: hypothetical protein VD741_05435 [Solirubrobacterales bacterium]|nr:hypothetical protein [Solirubrobacterales bacterium]